MVIKHTKTSCPVNFLSFHYLSVNHKLHQWSCLCTLRVKLKLRICVVYSGIPVLCSTSVLYKAVYVKQSSNRYWEGMVGTGIWLDMAAGVQKWGSDSMEHCREADNIHQSSLTRGKCLSPHKQLQRSPHPPLLGEKSWAFNLTLDYTSFLILCQLNSDDC